jgi:hypothetical protein
MIRGQDVPLNIYVSHDCRLTITDSDGAGCFFGYCALKARNVISHIVDIPAGTDYIQLPDDGEEQVITNLGAELWGGGGFPNDYPDITAQILVGGQVSNLLEASTPSLDWNDKLEIYIDHTRNLNINNPNIADNEVFISGYTNRRY